MISSYNIEDRRWKKLTNAKMTNFIMLGQLLKKMHKALMQIINTVILDIYLYIDFPKGKFVFIKKSDCLILCSLEVSRRSESNKTKFEKCVCACVYEQIFDLYSMFSQKRLSRFQIFKSRSM